MPWSCHDTRPCAECACAVLLVVLALLPSAGASDAAVTPTIITHATAGVWEGCEAIGGRPSTVLSAAAQAAVAEGMQKAAVQEAMLGGYFPEEQTVGGSWVWMAPHWESVGGIPFYSRYTKKYNYAYPIEGVFSAFGQDKVNTYPADSDVDTPTKRYVFASANAITPYEWFNGGEVLPGRVCDFTPFPSTQSPSPTPTPPDSEKAKRAFPVWAIVLIVVLGVLAIVAVVIVVCCCCCRRGGGGAGPSGDEARARREAARARRAKMAEERRSRSASQRRRHPLSALGRELQTDKNGSFSLSGSTGDGMLDHEDDDDDTNVSRGTVSLLRRGSVSIVVPDEATE